MRGVVGCLLLSRCEVLLLAWAWGVVCLCREGSRFRFFSRLVPTILRSILRGLRDGRG